MYGKRSRAVVEGVPARGELWVKGRNKEPGLETRRKGARRIEGCQTRDRAKKGKRVRNDKGKRMELGRAAGSGPFRCFLKHRGKNVAIFGEGVGGSEAFTVCVSKNTAAEAYEEERMNASGRRTRLAVRRLRLESTRAAKISQGRGFHQEKGTTNRLFRNTQKKKEKRKCRLSGAVPMVRCFCWEQDGEGNMASR